MDNSPSETTDLALFVRTSSSQIVKWDKQRIAEALVKETDIDEKVAQFICAEVEKFVKKERIKFITAPLIRELVNAKLIEYGYENIRKQHTRLGFPIFDVEQIITAHNKENANVPHGPEATNLTLAEGVKKEYALLNVFSADAADAHMNGDIHLHDLGFIDRPYCSGNSLEYVKKFGLSLPNSLSIAKPAKHPEVLIGQMIKFSAALQGTFAGAIGWDAVNLFLAPYLKGKTDKQLEQYAQILIFEFAQQAVARGGQSIFSDLNLYWEVPKHFANVPAIGPGGEFTGLTYQDYSEDARRFITALFSVYTQGDARGRPFFFPKPNLHITEKFFKTDGNDEFLEKAAKLSSEMGNTYYLLDRGDTAKISECCRLSFKLEAEDLEDAKTPWKMRYSAMQIATVNLPRIAYKAKGDDDKLFELLREHLQLIGKAHSQKRKFVKGLLDMEQKGPLGMLTMKEDGENYYRYNKASFLIGMVGLNELVQFHTGQELHESEDAFKFGLRVIATMKKETEKLKEEYDMKFVLEQTPAESTAHRLARLDMQMFPEQTKTVVKGFPDKNEIYYTNSTQLNISVPVNPIERVKKEGMFHPMIEAGSISHLWLGESRPDPSSISNFVKKVFKETTNDQIAFSPEFTHCLDCAKTTRGIPSDFGGM
ncbi:MAG: anaerobic ribonucleoside-triphosphate reductase [Candidatus Undinarchaeales archaeon]|jgi:ribonucleoside-triphosphate reductase|nr:anaerobic ribonucleoside-triphosphate reductase [Candidatus Undinarchaeales archaeon]